MPDEYTEQTITESDIRGQIAAAEDQLRAFTEKMMADGTGWRNVAAAMSALMVDVILENASPDQFAVEARHYIATSRYVARRYQEEIIKLRPQREAVSFFDLVEQSGHECHEA